MKRLLTPIFTLLLAPLAALHGAGAKPNIIILYADDLGYGDVGCYGATAVKTPNMDRLAREGLRFTDAHTSAATCTPSRYSLLTGEYPWRKAGTGVLPGDAALIIAPGRTTLPSLWQKAGYDLAETKDLAHQQPEKTNEPAEILRKAREAGRTR